MAKKILSTLLCVVLITSSIVLVSAADTSASSTGADTKYTTACQDLDDEYGYDGDDLGATYTHEATTFKVWSPLATEVKLNRFATGSDSETGAADLGTVDMEKLMDGDKFTGVWTVTVNGDIVNTYYTYSITTPNVLGDDSKTYETQDVYSRATGVNSKRSMVVDLSKTNPEGWDEDSHVLLDKATDSYVWEVHVKDFSYNENSGVSDANRGKYLAFTEEGTTLNGEGNIATCIDYLKNSGITTVQIQPFYDYGSVNEAGSDTQFNWGYDPVNYNVPEGSYSSNPYDGNVRIKEAKAMIKALHDAGLSVVMDVVYNHTYSADSSFTHTVPNYYYRMKADGSYSNGSGCGNDTASERKMYRNFMIQSCVYWATEYHIDGFRFDLMGLHDTETMTLIREALNGIDSKITLWGEGWSMDSAFPTKTCTGTKFRACTQSTAGSIIEGIGFFSDKERDALKGSVFNKKAGGWLQGATGSAGAIIAGMEGKCLTYGYREPAQVVTYAACHDNQALWDRLADSQGLQDYWRKRHPVLVAQNKLAGSILQMSQGITFILAGEEFGRSKDNDENSYSSSATENMIDWSLVSSNGDIASYYAGLREIRDNFSPLTSNSRDGSEFTLTTKTIPTEVTGRQNNGVVAIWSNKNASEWQKLLCIFNNTPDELNYTLSDSTKNWVVVADENQAGTKKLYEISDNKFTVPAFSSVIAVDKTSYESTLIQSDRCAVNVNTENKLTGVKESFVVTGRMGTGYAYSVADPALDVTFKNGSGIVTFTPEEQTIDAEIGYYVPESVDVDINDDGKKNINDATYIQLSFVNRITLTDEQKVMADTTMDGKIDINDVTMIQRNLAEMCVGLGTVTVNYYDEKGKKVTSSEVYTGRVGSSYTAYAPSFSKYLFDSESSETSYTVTVPYGNVDIDFNYIYNFVGRDVVINAKYAEGEGETPYVWIWGTKDGSNTDNYTVRGSWPGDELADVDAKGWFNKTFTVDLNDDSYNLVLSLNGDNQSNDITELNDDQLWIVFDGSNTKSGSIYNVDPEEDTEADPIKTF